MKKFLALSLGVLFLAPLAQGKDPGGAKDEPRKIAESYLKALEGSGSGDAREYLLGGVTLTAEIFTIPNWKFASREEVKIEEENLADAVKEMKELDRQGRKALDKLMDMTDNTEVRQITREQAEKIMKPTNKQAKRFKKKFPLFAYVARVDKEVYWHPKNPWRDMLDKLGTKDNYRLEFHRFNIAETDHGKKRVWPLRVLRMKTKDFDSGWKILPASDWDPES